MVESCVAGAGTRCLHKIPTKHIAGRAWLSGALSAQLLAAIPIKFCPPSVPDEAGTQSDPFGVCGTGSRFRGDERSEFRFR